MSNKSIVAIAIILGCLISYGINGTSLEYLIGEIWAIVMYWCGMKAQELLVFEEKL